MKRTLTLFMAMVFAFGLLTACGGETPATNTETTPATTEATEPTQPGEEGKMMKILTIGNSGAVDCGHMLAYVAAKEGYENFKVATLYYSGCSLAKHAAFMGQNASDYKLYVSSTDDPTTAPTIMNSVTMEQALRYDYWDIIVMQGTASEIADKEATVQSNINAIQKFVRENCMNPNAKFVWHMGWVPPTDNALRDTYPYPENNVYYTRYIPYGDDRNNFYNALTKSTQDLIVPNDTFQYIIPTATAMENALSSYFEEKDIHRDYYHATDLARVMNSYVWLCKIFGIEELTELKVDSIPMTLFKSMTGTQDYVFTEGEKNVMLEAINNALKTPFTMTQSQYTTAS